MNDIAKALWDKACKHLKDAEEVGDINSAICHTGMGELALKLASFALAAPNLVAGQEDYLPPGYVQAVGSPGPVPMPNLPGPVPTTGPKFWGAPQQ